MISEINAGSSLLGKRVLVTRTRDQASSLSNALRRAGAIPVEFPLIKVVPPESYEALDEAIDRLPGGYDWLIFTSANAVRYFADRLSEKGVDRAGLAGVKVAAIGPATARAAGESDFTVDFQPRESVAESVVEGFSSMAISGKRFLMPRAAVAREIIPNELRKMGAIVDVVDAYRTILNEEGAEELRHLFQTGVVDVVTFTSSSTVKNFLTLLGKNAVGLLCGVTIAAIGPVTADTARELGLTVDVVAREFTIPGLVQALSDDL